MIVSDAAINRSITVFVLLLLIVSVGIYSYIVIPRESAPEVIVPIITVTTSYEGVAPEDMESLVTIPIERKLTGIAGVKEIRSSSVEGMSSVIIEFEADMDIDDALQKVRDKVDLAKQDLPEDADDPAINEINISEFPIMVLALTGDLGLAVMTEVADNLEDRIEAVRGVLDVNVTGDVEREIQIEVDPERVARYGVSLADLVSLAKLENVNTPGGALELGEAKYLMRIPGEFTSPDELTGLIVKTGPTGVVYLRDIATVKDGYKEMSSLSRLNGKPSITLAISKRSGENIIFIADQVKQIVDEERRRMPPGMDIAVTMDQSNAIRDMVADLENNILSGLILVVAVILVAMGLSNAFFVSLAIPFSMLMTFALLQMTGVTLNMVVLFSLVLALGMLVDNGIVVVENIYRHVQAGEDPVSSAKIGASEVAWPVITSTLTTCAAFLPMFFWPGIMGSFMLYLPMTVTYALLGSLFVGLVVNPALAALFMRPYTGPPINIHEEPHPILKYYGAILRLALRWRAVTVTLFVTILAVISIEFLTKAHVEFMPTVEPERAYIEVKCPEGASLETSDALCREVEAQLEPFKDDLEFVITNVGSQGVSMDGSGGANATHLSRITLDFPKLENCKVLPSEIVRQVRVRLASISGAEVRIEKENQGPPTGPPVNIEISGDDYKVLASLAQQVRQTLKEKEIQGLVDVRDDYDKGKPEVRVLVDRQQAWMNGLNTQFIGLTVKAAVNGRKAGDYREGDEDYDVVVRFPKAFRENLANIESMNLISLSGRPIPFSSVAKLEQGTGLGSVKRINRKRTIAVSAAVEGRSGAEVLSEVREALRGLQLAPGYTIAFTGENEDQQESQAFLTKAFFVALLLISLIIVTQFNSILQTLIVMSSVILSLAGVFLGLWIHNMPFGILMTGIGTISLAGVVVNNAIVLIDFINQRRAQGMGVEDAIIEGGITRFRPVMLTAITTILGLIPMALRISYDFRNLKWVIDSESSQWWGSLAVAVAYGLAFATLLTLIVVPTLYSLSESLAASFRRGEASETVVSGEVVAK